MVELVHAGRWPEDLAREFEPTAQSIGNGVAKADKQKGHREEEEAPGLTTAKRDKLARLRREVRQLRVERDILSGRCTDRTVHGDAAKTPASSPVSAGAPS